MAFVSNQWLKGAVLREKTHRPVPVTLKLGHKDDAWSKRNNVIAVFAMERKDGDFHSVGLTQQDLATLLAGLIARADAATRVAIAAKALRGLQPQSIVAALSKALK